MVLVRCVVVNQKTNQPELLGPNPSKRMRLNTSRGVKGLVLNTLTRSDRARRSFEVPVRLEDGAVLVLDDHGQTRVPAPGPGADGRLHAQFHPLRVLAYHFAVAEAALHWKCRKWAD